MDVHCWKGMGNIGIHWHYCVLLVGQVTHKERGINLLLKYYRGSPIGFSGCGIWLILSSGFRIFWEKGSEIRDYRYERDTGSGNFAKRDSENIALKNRDQGSPLTKCTIKIKLSSSYNCHCACRA